MNGRWITTFGLGLFIVGCEKPLPPDQVKKVEQCIEVLGRDDLRPDEAKLAIKTFIEERALLEETIASTCRCYEGLPPEGTRYKQLLATETLAWVNTWDNEGRPKYLDQFFDCFRANPLAEEARQSALRAVEGRLGKQPKDSHPGLRAVLVMMNKATEDQQSCVVVDAVGPDGQQKLEPQNVMDYFTRPDGANTWDASGLELLFEPRPDCPASLRVQTLDEPSRVKITLNRGGVILFDRDYPTETLQAGALPDFLIP